MLKWFIRFVAAFTFAIRQSAKINRVLKIDGLRAGYRSSRVGHYCVADITIVANHLSCFAYMFSIVATKTAGEVEVADVVWMRLPIRLHFRKSVGLEDPL